MQKIRYGLITLLLLCSVSAAEAQISIGIGLPNVSIGINLPLYPELVPVPGYPVYYAPRVDGNYFFYDGMYWVYQDDNWYASSWYNGPWGFVDPQVVPLFILRVPVHYYRRPPVYFRGWQSDGPPRWGQHWGHGWEQRRSGWDRWDRRSVHAPAPLPVYQRQYSGDRYPRRVEQQQELRSRHYRYQPRDTVIRQHFEQPSGKRAPAAAQKGRKEAPETRSPRDHDIQRSTPQQQRAPAAKHTQPQQRGGENVQRPTPNQAPPQQRSPANKEQRQQQPAADQRQQQAPRSQGQGQGQQPQHQGGKNVQRPTPNQPPPQQRSPANKEQRQQQPAAQQQQAPREQEKGQKQDRGKSQEQKGGQGQGQNRDEGRGGGHNN
jgi:hypothetical protein